MDLSNLATKEAAERGTWFEVLDPFGNASGLELLVAGAHSERYRRSVAKMQATQHNRRLQRNQSKREPEDFEVEDDLLTEHAVRITLDWRGKDGEPVTFGDDVVEFSEATVRKLYDQAVDVRNQTLEVARNTRAFLSKGSGVTS